MSEVRPIARDLLFESFLYEPLPGPLLAAGALGVIESVGQEDLHLLGVGEEALEPLRDLDLMECLEGSDQVALRLACIGDEMDLRLRAPRLTRLPGMAMHSLALTYSQTGVRGILRSFIHRLASLRESLRAWGPPSPGAWVSPDKACRRLLPVALLTIVLLGGTWHLLPL